MRVTASAYRVAFDFLGYMLLTAVIREEDGKYCVRSPHNKDWNGGCFDTKGEAEKRLQQVEYFKRQAAEIKTVWIVRDWNNRIERVSEICWPEPVEDLPKYVLGTGLSLWERENTKLFTDESSAMKDLEKRLQVVDKMHEKAGLYRHMHSDGRIIYVSVPDRDS
jgi:hypothetical protein